MLNLFPNKFILTLILCFIFSPVISQRWLEMIGSQPVNYFEAYQAFEQWNDTALQVLKGGSAVSGHEVQEVKDLQKQFKHWATNFRSRMDVHGNYLSDDMLWQQHENYVRSPFSGITTATAGNWQPIGPISTFPKVQNYGNGLVSTIGVNYQDTAIIYIGTPGGGLWKTTNGGVDWFPLTDSIAYLGVNFVAVDPVHGDTLYMLVRNRIYKSTNGGNQWTQLAIPGVPFNGTLSKIIINPINSNILYVIGSNSIYKSGDGGNTWTTIFNQLIRDFVLNPLDPEIIYMINMGKFYRSYNGGQTFDTIPVTMPYNGPFSIGVTPADTSYIYLYTGVGSGSTGLVAKSIDGGSTFINQPTSNDLWTFNTLKIIQVSSSDKNKVMFGGIYIDFSTDGGDTWNRAIKGDANQVSPLPFVHVDQRQMLTIGNTVWFANDGGVYKTDDFGGTFQDLTGNLQITELNSIACSQIDSLAIIGGAPHNGMIQLTDSGWACVGNFDGIDVGMNPGNPLDIYYKSQYGYYHSMDGGLTTLPINGITESAYGFSAVNPVVFNGQNPAAVYMLIKNVWKSVDNGSNFTQISSFNNDQDGGGFIYVCPNDSNFIYTAYMRSFDGGVTWSEYTPSDIGYFLKLAVDPDQPLRIWAASRALERVLIRYSDDGGNTWQEFPTPDLPFTYARDFKYVDNGFDGLLLSLTTGVYYIDNRLSNWQPFINGLPNSSVVAMFPLTNINKIRVATNGRGFWESDFYDASQPPVADFFADTDSVCPGQSVKFYDNSLNNGPGFNAIYNWSFTGGLPSSSTDAQPSVTYPAPGLYTVKLTVSNINGQDSITKTGYIFVENPVPVTAPITEDFESVSFPPSGWKIINDDYDYDKWGYAFTGGYSQSLQCASVRNYALAPLPKRELLMTVMFDLMALQYPILFFDRAYAMDNLLNADTLKIFYTTDCDNTRNYIYTKGGAVLATGPPTINSFVPDSSQWVTDTVSLAGVPTQIQLGFESMNYNGNYLYIDNINISDGNPTSLQDFNLKEFVSIFPVPANEQVFVIWKSPSPMTAYLTICNYLGQKIYDHPLISGLTHEINTSSFTSGIYLVKIDSGKEIIQRKLVLVK